MKKKIIVFLIPVLIYGLIVLTNNSYGNIKIGKNGYMEGNDDNKYVIEWQKFWGGNGYEGLKDTYRIDDGYIVFGETRSTDIEGLEDGYFMSRYDEHGNLIVSKNIESRYDFNPIKLSDGFIIPPTAEFDSNVRKIDYNGNIVWQRELTVEDLNLPEYDEDYGYKDIRYINFQVKEESDSLIFFGSVQVTSPLDYEGFIAKMSNNGDIIWVKTWGGKKDDYFRSFIDVDDGYIVFGNTYSNDIPGLINNGFVDVIIVKYDKDGNMIWQKNYGGSSSDNFKSGQEIEDGFIIFGETWSQDIPGLISNGFLDIFVVKYDKDGNMVWQKNYGGDDYDTIKDSIIKTSDGFVFNIESQSDSFGDYISRGGMDDILLKIDKEGNIAWIGKWGGNENDSNQTVTEVDDGYVVTGSTVSTDIEGLNINDGGYVIAKYDKDGNLLWIKNSKVYFKKIIPIGDKLFAIGDDYSDGYDNVTQVVHIYSLTGNLIFKMDLQCASLTINNIFENEDGFTLFSSGVLDGLTGNSQKLYYGNGNRDILVMKYTNNLNKEMKLKKKISYSKYKIGDEITYRGSKYHVIDNSNSNYSYVKLLKDDPLTSEELGIENNNDIPSFVYARNEELCLKEHVTSSCVTNYDLTFIKEYVDDWALRNFEDDLYEVDGYKARLISRNDMQNLGYTWKKFGYIGDNSKSWMNYEDLNFWAMDGYYFTSTDYPYVGNDYFSEPVTNPGFRFYKNIIRPVVNVKKSSLGSSETYNIGDKITYKNEDYYVIKQVSETDEYVVLLKYVPLTNSQINMNNAISYYKSDTCNSKVKTDCKSSFIPSDINKVLDDWSKNFKDDLKSQPVLITYSDLTRLGYRSEYDTYGAKFHATESTPDFVYDNEKVYWMMTSLNDSSSLGSVVQYYVLDRQVYETALVRPVIYLDKCAIEDGCVIEYVDEDEPEDPEDVIYDKPEIPEIGQEPEIIPIKDSDNEITIVEVENTLKRISIISIVVGIIMVVIGTFIYKKNK